MTDLTQTIENRLKAKPRKNTAGFYVEADLMTKLFAKASALEVTASQIVNELIRDFVDAKKQSANQKEAAE